MKDEITIKIKVNYGSEFQKKLFTEFIPITLAILKTTHESKHRKNKLEYTCVYEGDNKE